MSEPRHCRKARKRAIPFDCKLDAGHEGNCTPYTLPPMGNYLTRGLPDERCAVCGAVERSPLHAPDGNFNGGHDFIPRR